MVQIKYRLLKYDFQIKMKLKLSKFINYTKYYYFIDVFVDVASRDL